MNRKWRRLDEPGLEVLYTAPDADGLRAVSTIVHAGAESFGMSYVWLLDRNWRTRRLELQLLGPESREMTIERAHAGWLIDGREDPAFAACEEIDLSATPFCNALAVRLLKGSGELTTLYADIPSLQLLPSRQRYEELGQDRWRYIDLGAAKGFEADLTFDEDGLVVDYQGVFERIN